MSFHNQFLLNKYGDEPVPRLILQELKCPHCSYYIPIRDDLIDYKSLYEEQRELNNLQEDCFNDWLLELQEECPEVKIFVHNKITALKNLMEELKNRFRRGEIKNKGENQK